MWSGGWGRLLTALLGSDTRAEGQAEPGYGTAVETAAQGLADAGPAGAAVLVQGTATGSARDLSSGTVGGSGLGYWWLRGEGFWKSDRK